MKLFGKRERYILRKNTTIPGGKLWFEADDDWDELLTSNDLEMLIKAARMNSDYGFALYDIVSGNDEQCRYWISDESCFYRTDKSTHPTVYIDMDGTLFYWYPDGKGFAYPEEILDPEVHYYRDLEAHEYTVRLAKRLYDEGMDVCILSAADYKTIPDKMACCQKNLPFIPKENIFFCPIGAEKGAYGRRNAPISALIDDYHKNLDSFEKWGGIAIKLVTEQNSPDSSRFQLLCVDRERKEEYIDKDRERIQDVLLTEENQLDEVVSRGIQKSEDGTATEIRLPAKAYHRISQRGNLSNLYPQPEKEKEDVRAYLIHDKQRNRIFLKDEERNAFPLLPRERNLAKQIINRAKHREHGDYT